MAVNGKQKGNKFERDIANTLSERFAEFTGIEKSFRRNPDSGSFFGASNQARTEIYDTDFAVFGDLICPRSFNFCIECKNYKTAPGLASILKQEVTEWDEWLSQARQDAVNSQKEMMLIIKYNRVPIFVVLDRSVDLPPSGVYKESFIYTLDKILELGDDFFFST